MASPFVLSNAKAKIESLDNASMDDSDFEHLVPMDDVQQHRLRWFWLGKKHFESMMAESVFRTEASALSGEELDSAFVRRMAAYPYVESLGKLSASGCSSLNAIPGVHRTDHFIGLMTAIGVICDRGDGQQLHVLIDRQEAQPVEPFGERQNEEDNDATAVSAASQTAPQIAFTNAATADLPRYVSALKEYADSVSSFVTYDTEPLPSASPLFEATARIDGRSFQGRGKTKKQAKGVASRLACIQLGIVS